MRRYPQWLHGAFIQLACELPGVSKLELLQQNEGIIKLHALFGTELLISDVQLIDSPTTLQLFNNKSFVNYLIENKQFIKLVARPEKIVTSEAFSIASSGFQRAIKEGWTSSVFSDPDATKALGYAILEAGQVDLSKQLRDSQSAFHKITKKWPDRKLLLEGMLRGVAHFASTRKANTELPPSNKKIINLY